MRIHRLIAVSLASCLALPARAEWAAVPVEKGVAGAGLIVIGTLEGPTPFEEGKGDDAVEGVRAEIKIREILYGKSPDAPFSFEWRNMKCVKCPRVDHTYQAGKERIWLLSPHPNYTWGADHPDFVLPLEKRAEVEKAIQARLAPLRKILEDSDILSGWAHIEGTPEDTKACLELLKAGPAALPVTRGLLRHANAVQKAWGCRLAGCLKDKALAPDLEPLLEDAAPLKALTGDVSHETTVWAQGLAALGEIAGKPFATVREARLWLKEQSEMKK